MATTESGTATTNESAHRRWVESLNRGAPTVAETFAADAAIHLTGHPEVHDREGFTAVVGALLAAFPDIRFEVPERTVAGDVVAFRWIARATHTGDLLGIAPTGRAVEFEGQIVDQFRAGKVVRRWEQYDRLGLLQQIGAVPTPG
jgi:predicted ester cyclase